MVFDVCASEDDYNFFEKGIHDLMKQLMENRTRTNHVINDMDHKMAPDMDHEMAPTSQSISQPAGIKKREGTKRKKRRRGWVECQPSQPKKKQTPNVNISQSQQESVSKIFYELLL